MPDATNEITAITVSDQIAIIKNFCVLRIDLFILVGPALPDIPAARSTIIAAYCRSAAIVLRATKPARKKNATANTQLTTTLVHNPGPPLTCPGSIECRKADRP
jgi:hypothetical protein